jgi:hypothetical protein
VSGREDGCRRRHGRSYENCSARKLSVSGSCRTLLGAAQLDGQIGL